MPASHRAVLVTTVPGTNNPKNLAPGFPEPASALLLLTLGFVQHYFFKMLEEALDTAPGSGLCLETAQRPELQGQAWLL